MIVKLPFGSGVEALDLRGLRVRPLASNGPSASRDPGALIAAAVDRPLDGPPLVERARGKRSAALVVSDWTRPLPLPAILPVVLARLEAAAITADSITVIVACGTHPPIDDEDLRRFLGPLPPELRARQHDARAADRLVAVGELRPGMPLRVARDAVEADFLVTVGGVRHHYFAGFGGGPKMVFPGIAGYEEIQANHSLVLCGEGSQRRPDGRCRAGVLDGNPVAEEIARAAGERPPDFAVCSVAGSEGGIAWVGAGSWRTAFDAAVVAAREWFEVAVPEACDLMVASGGGGPTDATLVQAHKGLDAACDFLAPGGELLFTAALNDGLGSPEMEPFVADPRPRAIMDRLAEAWVQYGHTTLRLLDKTSRFRVHLHSRFDHTTAGDLGFLPVSDPETVLARWREEFEGATVGVMAGAPVYPRR